MKNTPNDSLPLLFCLIILLICLIKKKKVRFPFGNKEESKCVGTQLSNMTMEELSRIDECFKAHSCSAFRGCHGLR